ncbi:hypothetical protein BKA69DRAFT_313863 [Paraphysoderma sedebokerense]|nr:hypothetical protein BKA69DRAFT_313863 [Paraphysoderma sedebokerense]
MKDSAQCLFGYRMSYGSGGSDVTQCFRYPAKAAVPIISSRNDQYDVLFIRPDFSFSLWIGEEPLIPCILPQNIQSLFESKMNDSRGKRRRESWSEKEIRVNKEDAHQEGVPPKMIYYSPSRTSRPVALSDSALDRLNIVMSSGVVYRCSAYFNPPGVLTQSCINILGFVMPQKEMCLLRTRFLQLVHTETHKAAIGNGDAWEAFMITLYSFLHRSPEITKSKTSAVSDWDYMLSSSTHHRLDGEALTAGLNSPTGNQNVLGTPKHLFEASKEIQILYPAVPDLIQYLPSIIQALHLVYEDFKLNVLTQKFLLPLARLLVQLSKFIQAASHVNYYVKEHSIDILQHAVDIVLSRNVEPLSSPRNIFEFLHDKLHQQYSEPFPTPGSILPRSKLTRPLLSKVCDNTRKICLLYDILSDPSRPAIDVVRCLAQEGFKQSDFDVLPFGLEIPIREILWVFKHNPPLELTPETYALIGD